MSPKSWPSSVAPAPGAITDVNLIQYLGVACGPLNPIDSDMVDRAARLLGIVYGSAGQILQLVPADGLAPGNSLEVAGFNFVYNGATWDMVREGAAAGSMLTDPADRAARLLGITYGNQAQLQQVAGTLELITQDTGLNTNPRRYEKDNGFYSAPIARAGGVATALWTIATAPARTAGQVTTIYTLVIENATGAAITGWLEIGGVAITPNYHVNNDETAVITFEAGLTSGNADVNCNASANAVVFQVIGTEA